MQASALEPNLTLLQFVALALPALAILMQAVIRFHDSFGEDHSGSTLQIEFRLLETSFAGLVGAAIIFSIGLFRDTTSIVTQLGIVIIGLSLILIFPVTWFALRRPNYPSKKYESPEEAALDTGKTIYKFGKFTVPLTAILIIGQISGVPLAQQVFQFIVDLPVRVFIYSLIGMIFSFATVVTTFNLVENSLTSRREEEWASRTANMLSEIENINHENLNGNKKNDRTRIMNRVENLKSKIDDSIESAPKHIDTDMLSELKIFSDTLTVIKEEIQKLENIEDEIEYFEEQKEKEEKILGDDTDSPNNRSLGDYSKESPPNKEEKAQENLVSLETKIEVLNDEKDETMDRIKERFDEIVDMRIQIEEELNKISG